MSMPRKFKPSKMKHNNQKNQEKDLMISTGIEDPHQSYLRACIIINKTCTFTKLKGETKDNCKRNKNKNKDQNHDELQDKTCTLMET